MTHTESSSLLLVGVGGASCRAVSRISQGLPASARVLLVDTDRAGAVGGLPFALCGEGRLAGRGTGGNSAAGKAAFQDDPSVIDSCLSGVRVAVVVACLGGGTGGGLAPEILKRLAAKGVVTLAFATMPFGVEGAEPIRRARIAKTLVSQYADTSVFLTMDELAGADDLPLAKALERGLEKLSAGVTLLWRLVETPGYIRFDPERLRAMLSDGGMARFGYATAKGPSRAGAVLEELRLSRGMAVSTRVKSYFTGILAGEDLRLAEVGDVAGALAMRLGQEVPASLATVNDEASFSGTLSVVVFVFEVASRPVKRGKAAQEPPAPEDSAPQNPADADATIYNGENLDIPTYIRQNITIQ